MPSAMAACPLPQRKGNSNRVYSAITSRKAASSLAVVICWAFSRRKICRLIGFVVWRAVWGPQFTGIAEDGEDIAQNGIGQFRISPGGWPKMAGIPTQYCTFLSTSGDAARAGGP